MKHTIADFFGAALVPELGSNIAQVRRATLSFSWSLVAAMRTFPHELAIVFDNLDFAIKAAHLTVIALGIQLGIHDVVRRR